MEAEHEKREVFFLLLFRFCFSVPRCFSSVLRAEIETLPSAENAVSLFSQRGCLHASESVYSKERSRPPCRNVQKEKKKKRNLLKSSRK